MNNIHKLQETHEIRYNRAANHLCKGDVEAALNIANSLIKEGYLHGHAIAGLAYEQIELYEDAFMHYERATRTVGAMGGWLGVARLCYLGKGVEQNYERAFYCYQVEIEDGDNPRAWLMHGIMYRLGYGVDKDLNKAKECLRIAEDRGYVFATTNLALIDWEEGRYLKSTFKRLKAAWRTVAIMIKSGNNDIRISYPPP